MTEAGTVAGTLFGLVVMLVVIVYPYLALGRIWFYSKQQVELLKDIQKSLRQGS